MSKNRFCLIWGVLAWGLTSGVAFAYVMSATRGNDFLPWLAISVPAFGAGGYVWGLIMWRARQRSQPRLPAATK